MDDLVRKAGDHHRRQRERHHGEGARELLDEGQPGRAVGVARHEREVEPPHAPEPDGDQRDPPDPAQQQREEDRSHDVGAPPAAEAQPAVGVDRPRHGVLAQLRMVGERPCERRAEDEHPGQRAVAQAPHVAQERVERRARRRADQAAADELRDDAQRRLVQGGFSQHQQRNRDEAAHVDAVVLQQLLAGGIVPEASGRGSPDDDRQPGDAAPGTPRGGRRPGRSPARGAAVGASAAEARSRRARTRCPLQGRGPQVAACSSPRSSPDAGRAPVPHRRHHFAGTALLQLASGL